MVFLSDYSVACSTGGCDRGDKYIDVVNVNRVRAVRYIKSQIIFGLLVYAFAALMGCVFVLILFVLTMLWAV